ncbi:MAG: hypothetical protein JSV37_05195 [Anaerolineaceae bacterium]|nr:MAG: hypothetical protein JSV37_05195 [Anaerolineaceae bacterium]
MRQSMRFVAIIFLITPILLTACKGDRTATESTPLMVEEPTQEPISQIESPEVPAPAFAATPETEASPDVDPTPRQGLEATDPSTVLLASGKPTLVEFFAFW